jgi:hypothetical protein
VHLPTQNRLNVQNGTTATNHLYESFDPSLGNASNPNNLTGGVVGNTSATAYPYTVLEDTYVSHVPAFTAAGFTSNIVAFMPWSSSMYNGMATQLTRRFANGLQFNSAFTWSNTMDDATATAFSTYLTPRRPQDFRDVKADWSRSALDRKYRITFAMVYDFPFFKTSSNIWEKNILGGWTIAPVFTYQSPEYATVEGGYDANLNDDGAGDRAFVNPLGKKGTGSDINEIWDPNLPSVYGTGANAYSSYGCEMVGANCVGDAAGWAPVTGNTYYVAAGPGTFPNGKRNDLALPAIKDVDASAMKSFSLYKQTKLEFSAQIWNVLNKSQYVPGSLNNIGSYGYASTTAMGVATHGMLVPGDTTFNHPEQVFNNNARAMQLALKLVF